MDTCFGVIRLTSNFHPSKKINFKNYSYKEEILQCALGNGKQWQNSIFDLTINFFHFDFQNRFIGPQNRFYFEVDILLIKSKVYQKHLKIKK